jgi:hypothetical protein
MQQLPSPSPEPPTYWPMEPLDLANPPWGRREMPCAIHGKGPCLYSVAQRQPVFSSPAMGEGEEGFADVEGMAEVTVVEEDDVAMVAITNKDDESVEVILVPDSSSPRLAYKQMARIWIGPQG